MIYYITHLIVGLITRISMVGSVDGSKVWKASEDRRRYASENVETDINGWGPCQLHPGTHVIRFGCFLPDLTW
jgi:hypothetical protein